MSLLILKDVEKAFEGVRALKPLSLELRTGEVSGVIAKTALGISHRILVMREGSLSAEFIGDDMTAENVIRAASSLISTATFPIPAKA